MKVSSVLEMKRHGNDDDSSGYSKAVFGNSVMENVVETHVLAVDDCVIDRKVIERLLRTDSVKVTTVESAARALEVLGVKEEQPLMVTSNDAFKFSMIITDYCMPGMTGYDLLKKLKEIKGLKEIPVVIMSSENVPQRIQRCLEEGAKDFIIKPVQREDIKKLRGHIKVRQSTAVAAASNGNVTGVSACKKRKKMPSVGLAEENSERRPRVGGVIVA